MFSLLLIIIPHMINILLFSIFSILKPIFVRAPKLILVPKNLSLLVTLVL